MTYNGSFTCLYNRTTVQVTREWVWSEYSMEIVQVGHNFTGQLFVYVIPNFSPGPGRATYSITGSVGAWEGGEITRGSGRGGWYPLTVQVSRVTGNSDFYPATLETLAELYGDGNLSMYFWGASDCANPSRTDSELSGSVGGDTSR